MVRKSWGRSTRRFFNRAKSKVVHKSDLVSFFVYHITIELGEVCATALAVRQCYEACDLIPPSWLASHLSDGVSSRFFIKKDKGYRLEDSAREKIAASLDHNSAMIETNASLIALEAQIPVGAKRDFLHETINCYGVKAFRATVVMCWNLTIHHLQDHILCDPSRMGAFNAVLAKSTDTRVKIKAVNKPDDFTEIPESKFLLFCREAKLITTSVYNKLDKALHDRNAAAHPSGVKVTPKAAEALIEDLIENVVKKFAA
jgi:hypothetical protein